MNVRRPISPRGTRILLPVLLAVLVGLGSCVDGDDPVGYASGGVAMLALVPEYAPSAVAAQAGPISRIRVTARLASTGRVLTTFVTDVDPNAAEWNLQIPVPIPEGGGQVVLTIELISVSGGVETVEYSGKTDPITLSATTASSTPTQSVPVSRGPASNLDVTRVVVTPDSVRIREGGTAALSAAVTTSGSGSPTVYWASLEPTIASVAADGTVTGLLPGVARIVAEAGPRADTARVVVTAVPRSVVVAPDSQQVGALGAEATYTAEVRDARGAAIGGSEVLWRSLDPARAGSLGGGRFTALAGGRARIEARAAADTTLKDTAVLAVVIPDVDVGLTKTASRAEAFEGDTVRFTITATSTGTGAAGNLQISDVLPAGLAFVSASATSGAYDAGTGIWSVGTLLGGASATLTLATRVSGAQSGTTLVNTAQLTGVVTDVDIDAQNNSASAQVQIRRRLADLALTKTSTAASVREGGTVGFTLTLQNLGPDTARSVVVTDSMPSALRVDVVVPSVGTVEGGGLVWRVPVLAPGQTASLQLTTTATSFDATRLTLTNVARVTETAVTDPVATNNRAVRSIGTGPATADLKVTKTVDKATAAPGDTVAFTVVVTNLGPDSVSNVRLSEKPDTSFLIRSSRVTRGTFDAAARVWTVGTMRSGQVDTLVLKAEVKEHAASTTIRNVVALLARTSGPVDPDAANDTASVGVGVGHSTVDLSLTKTVDKANPFEGDTVTYSVTVTNAGPTTASGVSVKDSLDAGLSATSHTVAQGAFDPGTGVWTVGDLAPGASATLELRTTIDVGTGGQTLTNTARSLNSQPQTDTNAANDAASASVTVGARSTDIGLVGTPTSATLAEGSPLVFDVMMTNHGAQTANNITAKGVVGPGLTLDSAKVTRGTLDVPTGTWTLADLAPGASESFKLFARVAAGTAGSTVSARAYRVASSPTDANPANDTTTAFITVPGIDLAVTKVADKSQVKPGDTLTYTVTVTNHGPVAATGVQLKDSIPAELTVSTSTATRGTFSAHVWAIDTLASSASATLTVKSVVQTGTDGKTLTNQVQRLATLQTDTFPSNDAASVAVDVKPVDLKVTKTVVKDTVTAGAPATYTITVTNQNTAVTATNVIVTDSLPAGLGVTTATPGQGTFDTPTKVWTVGTLAPSASATLTLVVTTSTGDGGKTLQNTAYVSAVDQLETAPADDTARVSLTLAEPAKSVVYSSFANTEVVIGAVTRPTTPHFYRPDTLLSGSVVTKVTEAVAGCGALTCTTAKGSTVTMTATGFVTSYRPLADSTGADTLTFSTDYGGNGSLTINLGTKVWYVDSSNLPGPGTGTSWDPFLGIGSTDPSEAPPLFGEPGPALAAAAGDIIRVSGGSQGGTSLEVNQTLSGAGADLVIGTDTVSHAGTAPTITGTVYLSQGVTVEGLTMSGATGDALSGTPNGVTIRDVTITNPTGDGIDFNATTSGSTTLDSVTISGVGARALAVRGSSGTISATNMSITASGAGRMGIEIFGGAPSFTYSGTASVSGPGFALLQVDSTTGGSVSLRGGPYTAVADTAARFRHAQGTIRVDSLTVSPPTKVGVSIETLTSTTPSYTFNELAIDTTSIVAFSVEGGSPTITANVSAGSINVAAGNPVYVYQTSNADITFAGGTIRSTGAGVYLGYNTGSTIRLANTLDLRPVVGQRAFFADGVGTVEVTGTGNRAITSNKEAVYIGSTSIGAAGVSFQEVSVSGTSSTYGVYLYQTGSGPFSITGTGTTDGSGGTITGRSHAVYAQNAGPVTLKNMNLTQSVWNGVLAQEMAGLTVDNLDIVCTACGTGTRWGIIMDDVTGTSSVTNTTIDGWAKSGLLVDMSEAGNSGTLTVSNTTIKNAGDYGIYAWANNTASGTVSLTVNATSNTIQDNTLGGIRTSVFQPGTGTTLQFDLDGNVISGNGGDAVFAETRSGTVSSSKLEGKIRNNTIAHAPGALSGAIHVNVNDGAGVLSLTGNALGTSGTPLGGQVRGIEVEIGGGSSSTADADLTITGNTAYTGDWPGLDVTQTDTGPICLNLKDNEMNGSWSDFDPYQLTSSASSAFNVERLGSATIADHLASENKVNGSLDVVASFVASGTFSAVADGSCTSPSN